MRYTALGILGIIALFLFFQVLSTLSLILQGFIPVTSLLVNGVLFILAIGGLRLVWKKFPTATQPSISPSDQKRTNTLRRNFVGSLLFIFAPALIAGVLSLFFGDEAWVWASLGILTGPIGVIGAIVSGIGLLRSGSKTTEKPTETVSTNISSTPTESSTQ